MNENLTKRAYEDLATRSHFPTEQTSWTDALSAVERAAESASNIHAQAVIYYVSEQQPIGSLVEQVLIAGALAFEAAAAVALSEDRCDPEDAVEIQRRRFQDLVASRESELIGPPTTYRAERLLWFIARYMGGAEAHMRRAEVDPVSRAFAVDDLLEVGVFAWFLSDLISHAGDADPSAWRASTSARGAIQRR